MKTPYKWLAALTGVGLLLTALNVHGVEKPITIVRFTPPQAKEDVSHDYLFQALKLGLEKSVPEFGPFQVEFMPVSLGQAQVLQLLDIEGVLDVVASAPTTERETQFRPARVPLFMGLLGYRMMIIRPEDEAKFKAITRPKQLKALRACQGSSWPDADIMEADGYQVVRIDEFRDMYEYMRTGRCDYFPRAITEGYGELASHNREFPDDPLLAFDDILIHYTVPLYFFTSHRQFELSERIELGLTRAVKDGSLLALMQRHPVSKVVFPLSQWQNATIFEVDNPEQLKTLRLYRQYLWQRLPAKNIVRE
ncbi:hypothetical protein [Motilimonas pumila]|uniref:Solute-binding protein family 3/N-terminal domain-containing protein n=1 Tax=Motilimonas pumila TaxID=2303987 RepID=A0A418YE99_9GAMM|nr:hypothetical protein [Motilimonas pumila]RJG47460.1 hypothetical protein D1Z90_11145 [Motilimonas pumila]